MTRSNIDVPLRFWRFQYCSDSLDVEAKGNYVNLRLIAAAGAACLLPAPSSAATLLYEFSTEEPFAGGRVAFSLRSDTPLQTNTFIEAAALSSFTPGIARVRFTDACFTFVPGATSSVACDIVEVIVQQSFGSTNVARILQDGALTTPGRYTSVNATSFPGTMIVSEAAAAVPEPATWALMLAGFGLTGYALRRRRAKVTFA